jgi:hypothetical protein
MLASGQGADKGTLLIIWDGLPAHRSKRVRQYIDSIEAEIVLERLMPIIAEPYNALTALSSTSFPCCFALSKNRSRMPFAQIQNSVGSR